eukprot:5760318-Ditylum_brightwellii.AAC.2
MPAQVISCGTESNCSNCARLSVIYVLFMCMHIFTKLKAHMMIIFNVAACDECPRAQRCTDCQSGQECVHLKNGEVNQFHHHSSRNSFVRKGGIGALDLFLNSLIQTLDITNVLILCTDDE